MKQTRKLDISNIAEEIVKELKVEQISLLGVLLRSIVKGKNRLTDNEIKQIHEIANSPKDESLPKQAKQFLLDISNESEELKYFVSKMQSNIIKELEKDNTISVEEIEELREFFTAEYLKDCQNMDRTKRNIKILVIAVAMDKIVPLEECKGISALIYNLITKIPMESIIDLDDAMCEAYSIIYNIF